MSSFKKSLLFAVLIRTFPDMSATLPESANLTNSLTSLSLFNLFLAFWAALKSFTWVVFTSPGDLPNAWTSCFLNLSELTEVLDSSKLLSFKSLNIVSIYSLKVDPSAFNFAWYSSPQKEGGIKSAIL